MQYLGIHPFVVKNTVTKFAEYANTATSIGSAIMGSFAGLTAQKAAQPSTPPTSPSAWSKWGPAAYAVGGAVLAGAYYARDDLTQGLTWATDHLAFVGKLWDEVGLEKRVEDLVDIEKEYGVTFRTSVLPSQFHLHCSLLALSLGCIPCYLQNHHNTWLPVLSSFYPSTRVGRRNILCLQTTRSLIMKSKATLGCFPCRRMMDIIRLDVCALI